MPELPDITVYVESLAAHIVGATLTGARLKSLFLVRTAVPPLADAFGRKVTGVGRQGKRIIIDLSGELHLVLHLMIAGRLTWKKAAGAKLPGRGALAALDFTTGTLIVTEAGKKQRASLHVVAGAEALAAMDRGGVEPLACDLAAFTAALTCENHTLKRALTDPTLFSGIGNAYSDEILHRARLSPLTWTSRLTDDETGRLFIATQTVLSEWTERLRAEAAPDGWPLKVTAFREGMAVHGRFGQPCPVCATPVQRIAYADNETNYCPTCQTEGKLLADRALSKLMRGDWPKTLAELEERKRRLKGDDGT